MKTSKFFNFKSFALTILSIFFISAGSYANDVYFSSETIIRGFEREAPFENDELIAPAYEYLQMDYGSLSSNGFSFHIYGWGRTDLSGSDYFEENSDGELLYGYVAYSDALNYLNLKLGRIQVVEGNASDSIDGLYTNYTLPLNFDISLYGGLPVALDADNSRNGDSIWGTRVSHSLGSTYDIGLSYKQLYNDSIEETERLATDIFLGLPGGIFLAGCSSRNLNTSQWAEHSYNLNFSLTDFSIQPLYQKYQYENFFETGTNSANPFRYLAATGETLSVIGGDIFWIKHLTWDAGIRLKHYDYDLSNESSLYSSGVLNWYGENLTQAGCEAGIMDGDDSRNKYLLARLFFFRDQLSIGNVSSFFSGDIMYVDYDEAVYEKNYSFFSSMAIGSRFLDDTLELKFSCDYTTGPYFDSDFRVMLNTTYQLKRMSEH